MEKNKIDILLHKLEFLKFALSNTVDPINVIHLEGQIKEIEDEIEQIRSNEFTEQVTTDFSPPPHETETYKKIMKTESISDNRLYDIAVKHAYDDSTDSTSQDKIDKMLSHLKKQLIMGKKVESEHTSNEKVAMKIAMDHLEEDPNYYTKLKKIEPTEQTMASSSGSFEAPAIGGMVKRKINKIPNMNEAQSEVKEVTDASSSGAFDVPAFGKTTKGGRKNPLKIDGVKSIAKSRAVKDKNFPKWGGPDSVFVKVKEKCKKFPYCNQGDINAIEPLRESIENAAKKYGLPIKEVEKIVLNEIKQIFI